MEGVHTTFSAYELPKKLAHFPQNQSTVSLCYCLAYIVSSFSNEPVPLQQNILSHLLQLWQASRTIYSAVFKATQNQQAIRKFLNSYSGSHIVVPQMQT